MAQLSTVKLSRFDSQPWGFRLQGGKDFGQPLAIQKVNGNSLAEKAGLQAGDSLIRVNNVDLFNLSHKEAQNALVRAGNSFELTIQRGGSTWKPSVTPIGPTPSVQNTGNIQPVTKTSLAYKQPPAPAVGSGHNVAAKPFGGQQLNGDTAKNLANKMYNSPINIYSEENIAETLSAQTEVLAGGVLGVNFKKNEKTYNAANSEVLKMVQEIDNEPREPEPAYAPAPVSAPTTPKVSSAPVTNPLLGLRHVSAPETKPEAPQDPLKILPPGQNICADCERLIVGLFVRIKDKNLHVECFKCATCGQSLKNVGYYNINNKLYCDVHAKLVARQNPPAPNLDPITIPPGVKPPSSIIGSALASAPSSLPPFQSALQSPGAGPGSPLPGTLAPLPFHAAQSGIRHVNAPRSAPFLSQAPAAAPSYNPAPAQTYAPVSAPTYAPPPVSSYQAPKPNLGPGPVAPRPLSDVNQTNEGLHYQSYSTVSQSSYNLSENKNVSFESSAVSQACKEQTLQSFSSQELSQSSQKKMSICSQELATLHFDTQNVVQQLSEIIEGQERCPSPTPADEVVRRVFESEVSKEESLQKIEQQHGWKNYQASEGQQHVNSRESGLSFLKSHSTSVAELEALYDKQQQEIQEQLEQIKVLGAKKRMSVDMTQIKEIEGLIVESQNQILEKQERQKEIEKKKRVRFEEEEEIRRQSVQVQESDLANLRETVRKQEEEERRKLEEQSRLQEKQRQAEENNRRQQEQKAAEDLRRQEETRRARELQEAQRREEERQFTEEVSFSEEMVQQQSQRSQFLSVDHHRERARTPVAEFEAHERHEGMSRKTENIFHTYEHLVQDEEEDEELERAAQEVPAKQSRPVTPGRGVSPYPGSIPGAEVHLMLKNIQGIQFEFDLKKATGKPEPKTFKLPDLRNLGPAKPYTPSQAPPKDPEPQAVSEPVQMPLQTQSFESEVKRASIPVIGVESLPSSSAPRQSIPSAVAPEQQTDVRAQAPQLPPLTQPYESPIKRTSVPVIGVESLPSSLAPRQSIPSAVAPEQQTGVKAQAQSQEQQIKEQRKQVHQELFSNQRFLKKQERLGAPQPRFERAKTPVAELEDEVRHHEASERTQHIYESFDQVIQSADRPRSRIGQPVPENQSINEAEKALFFQNISGLNYEFENISELTALKHLPEQQKSLFQRDVEQRTKSPLTVGVNNFGKNPAPLWNPNPEPYKSQFVQALTTIPDTSNSSKKTYEESLYKRHQLEQQAPQKPGVVSNLPRPSSFLEALTIAPDRPYSPLPTLPSAPPPLPVLEQQPIAEPKPVEPSFIPPEPSVLPIEYPPLEPLPELDAEPLSEAPKYDGARRRSSGFPGVNVQRTPYQMLRGSQIQTAFTEELKSQETSISQFVSQQSTQKRRDTVDAAFGLIPSAPEIAYAPPPPPEKRAELIASQAKFGSAVQVKQEPPKSEGKAIVKPMSMIEALTIAPDSGYCPFAEAKKPQATLVHGGSAVALTKSVETVENTFVPPPPPPIEIKPNYQIKDLQLNKSSIDKSGVTGFVEEKKASAAEAGTIEGQGITYIYQKQVEQSSSAIELTKVSTNDSDVKQLVPGFPPVTQELQGEFSSLKQSESSQKSATQTQQVQQVGNVTKTTKRSVVEVEEHSRKEFTQVRVIGGRDPVSGLRRTSSENVVSKSASSAASAASSYQSVSSSGLQKPTGIPTYQSLLSEKVPEPLPPAVQAGRIEAKDFTPRPRSAIGGKVSKPEPSNVPTAFRSRTPVPIPKIDYNAKPQVPEIRNKNLPTYNQDQVYRSASPRPIPVPKAQYASYSSPQVSSLKPAAPSVYRSTSPVPVPHMVKTTESYQQPLPSWRVQPKPEKRVSWPPKEEALAQPIIQIPNVTSQTSVKSLVTQQEEQAIEAARRSSIPNVAKNVESTSLYTSASQSSITSQQTTSQKTIVSQQQQQLQQRQQSVSFSQQENIVESDTLRRGSVKAMITAQEEQAKKNEAEARRTSTTPAAGVSTPVGNKTSLVGKNAYPTPKHDPITAPRPFGTPTPQRKIATPHFQPITPVAITEGSQSQITAPKLTFSTSQAPTSSLERKISLTLTSSSASAFKPIDSPIKPVPCKPSLNPSTIPTSTVTPNSNAPDTKPDAGGPGAGKGAAFAGATAPRRGRGVLNPPSAQRIPQCAQCNGQVRGPFITALGKIWCPDHFICATPQCRRPLADIGFVEEQGQLYCEFCFEKYIAPNCDKCSQKIKGDCLNAIGKHFHPECFVCAYCGKLFGNSAFFLEDGLPYCENDWNELFTTKCFACGFPIEAGDRWVEALNNNYHSQCFNCTTCKKNLEGQSFFAKGGRPFCKAHAR